MSYTIRCNECGYEEAYYGFSHDTNSCSSCASVGCDKCVPLTYCDECLMPICDLCLTDGICNDCKELKE